MAKKKKLTESQKRSKSFENAAKAIKEGKIVTVDKDALINIPVVGAFRDYISETLNYLFTFKSEEETIKVLTHIRNGFKDIPEDAEYDPYMNSVWCLMTLLTEINHQAAQQGATIITDENFDESLSDLVNSFDIGTQEQTEETFKETKKVYKEKIEKMRDTESKNSNED